MPRLPEVGGDDNEWGEILNEFLEVEHNGDGTLKSSGTLGAYAPLASPTFTGSVTVPTPTNTTDAVTKQYVDNALSAKANDSDVVKLTGNQTVAGVKTFTSEIFASYGSNGKVIIGSEPSVGGSVALYNDASDDDEHPMLGVSAAGVFMGSGSAGPDTVINRAGAGHISFNSARLSGVVDPVDIQDAATKKYVDDETTRVSKPTLDGGVPYRSDGLSVLHEALNSADSNPVDIAVVGDSITALIGHGAAYRRLGEMLSGRWGSRQPGTNGQFVYGNLNGATCFNTSDATQSNLGLGAASLIMSNGHTATHTGECDGISIVYREFATGGQLQVRDGGPSGTLLTTINTAGSGGYSQIWQSGALDWQSRQIHLTAVCGPGETVQFEGAYFHHGTRTSGVRVWSGARTGYTTQQFMDEPSRFLTLVERLEAAGTLKGVVVTLGTNDTTNYATRITNFIEELRNRTDASIVAWVPWRSNPFTRDHANAGRAALESLNVPLVDGSRVFGDVRLPNARDLSYDGTHPTTNGSKLIASSIAGLITGDAIGNALIYSREVASEHLPLTGGTLSGSLNVTGSVHATNEISAVNSNVSITSFFGAPGFNMKEAADSGVQISLGVTSIANALFGISSPSLGFGTGAGLPDAILSRSTTKQFSINNGTGTIQGNIAPIINIQTGSSYTLVSDDAGKQIIFYTAGDVTFTLPADSGATIPIGTIIPIRNGEHTLTIQAGSGASVTGDTTFNPLTSGSILKAAADIWVVTIYGGGTGDVTLTGTQTLTNKRIAPRLNTIASGSNITPTGDASDIYTVTALAVAATMEAPSGTPTGGQKLMLRIKDNGTARALTWNAIYRPIGVTLPTTTVANKTVYIGLIYNATDTKWDAVAVSQEA